MVSNLIETLVKHEGLKLYPYRDTVGKLTIGVGRNLDDNGISKDEALVLLNNDIFQAQYICKKEFEFWPKLNEPRQDVMTMLVFNMGIARVKEFFNTLGAIENGDFEKASEELLRSKWAEQVGNRAKELAEILRTGSYQ